jgi:hypothetical protein
MVQSEADNINLDSRFCKFGKFGIENLREIIKDQIDKTGRSPNV